MPTTSNSLLLAPDPISGESPSSWLQRLSLMHGVSTRTLLRSMGIRHVGDPDVDLTPHVYSTLVQGTNVSEACVDHLAGIYQHVSEKRYRGILLRDDQRQPAYRFCPQCLAGDEVPFLRVSWRFSDWNICPEHHVRMCYRCATCLSPFPALRPPRRFYVPDLRCCSNCAADLTLHPVNHIADEETAALTKTQRALASAFLLGRCFIKGNPNELPLHYLVTLMGLGHVEAHGRGNSRTAPKFRFGPKKRDRWHLRR
ncbi:TniQ family protein [Burkholderia seminalis]|uniref:TniQ family protein n=1 Tax=Burkholderia seminalis TaxID=488731 RepID=UPI003CD08C1D